MAVPSIMDVDIAGRRLLVRADLNVPVEGGTVTDATRIERFAAGMKPLLERGARLVVLSHFGRPKPNVPDPANSTAGLRPALAKALGVDVLFAGDCIGPSAAALSRKLADGEVLLCENLRFHAGETENDPGFAAELARLGDLYVNDAFSCAHRAHASTAAIAGLMPAYAGPLLLEEIAALSAVLEAPKRPSVAIVGGSKVSTKIAVLDNLVGKVDHVIIGGGMANTFLFAAGAPMGRSLHEADQVETVGRINARAAAAGCTIHLPEDVVAAEAFAPHAPHRVVGARECPEGALILDAGPRAVDAFRKVLEVCSTILWNGPLGAFEVPPFDEATKRLAETAAALTRHGRAVSVAGGGDTVAALHAARVAGDFTYVSTAGGAFLEWLEGRPLPGIAALEQGTRPA